MTDGRTHQSDGRLVGGRYRLAEPLGTGAAGTVWRAYDERTDREVAVREPRLPGDPGNPEDDAYRRAAHRLYREARAAARVDHPSAVSVHDVVVEEGDGADGLPWIVMELVRGETLRARVARGPLDPPEAARIGLAVLGALRAAHSVGIVHRELRPANVLVESGTDRVVLTDFGITGGRDADARFVAPERMSGRGAGPASDLWSLGALLRAAVEDGGPLDALITRLLDPDPERRPGAAEAAGELGAVAGEAVARGSVAEAVRASAPEAVRGAVSEAVRDAVPEAVRVSASGAVRDAGPEAVSEGTGGTGNAEAGTPPGLAAPPSHPRSPHPPRHPLHHPAALAFLGTLLLTALCLGVVLLPDATAGTPDGWARHREEGMHAVLVLPAGYQVSERRGGAADPPRVVVYTDADADASVRVRFAQWDTAPGSPMSRARQAREEWDGARTRYARTTVQGHEAVVADTTYRRGDGSPARALELLVRTDDRRMYSLRVDMPRSGANEREGAAVFEGARDRLEIGND